MGVGCVAIDVFLFSLSVRQMILLCIILSQASLGFIKEEVFELVIISNYNDCKLLLALPSYDF